VLAHFIRGKLHFRRLYGMGGKVRRQQTQDSDRTSSGSTAGTTRAGGTKTDTAGVQAATGVITTVMTIHEL
jgi:hypothetical protein